MESLLESLVILNITDLKLTETSDRTNNSIGPANTNGRAYPWKNQYRIPEGAIGSVVVAPTEDNKEAIVCYEGRTFVFPDFLSKVKVEYMFVHSLEDALKYGGIEKAFIKPWAIAVIDQTPTQSLNATNPYQNPQGQPSPGAILNGLKGQTFLEAGYVYAPYTPLITTPFIPNKV